MKTFFSFLVAAILVSFWSGCAAAYNLQGKVIAGDISYVTTISGSDSRLEQPGIGGVTIRLISEPDRLKREVIDEVVTNSDGTFSISFQKVGAGLMMYDVGITARRDGFAPAVSGGFRLPPESKRILILLVSGKDTYRDPIDDSPGAMIKRLKR